MRWRDLRRSENVEDRRGRPGGRAMAVGGGGLLMVIIVIVVALMGGDPSRLLQQLPPPGSGGGISLPGGAGAPGGAPVELSPQEKELGEFASAVLASTEDVWGKLFAEAGQRYEAPKLVLFTGTVQSGCGFASAQSGPFYCPADRKIYIDLSFFQELDRRFGAPGDFAQAYVIAHEVGHHVQNLLGMSDKVHQARGRVSEAEYNQLSVRLELQADYYAGVWAHHAHQYRNILEPGDVEEALGAASAIGDDRIQMQSQGYVVPDAFTHGTGEQRVRWFKKGLQSGDPAAGDTFRARDL